MYISYQNQFLCQKWTSLSSLAQQLWTRTRTLRKTKEIIKGTVDKFGLFRVRYSLITFAATPDVKIRFDNVFDTTEELGKLVDNVKKAFGDAALHKALEEVRYLFCTG